MPTSGRTMFASTNVEDFQQARQQTEFSTCESEHTFDGESDPHDIFPAAWVVFQTRVEDTDTRTRTSVGAYRSIFQTRSLSRLRGVSGSGTSSRCGRSTALKMIFSAEEVLLSFEHSPGQSSVWQLLLSRGRSLSSSEPLCNFRDLVKHRKLSGPEPRCEYHCSLVRKHNSERAGNRARAGGAFRAHRAISRARRENLVATSFTPFWRRLTMFRVFSTLVTCQLRLVGK